MLNHLHTLEPESNPSADPPETYRQKIAGLEKQVAYLEQIAKISQILNSTLELNSLLRKIAQIATELTGTEACSILLYDKHTGELRFTPATVSTSAEKLLDIAVPLDNSIAGWVFKKTRPLLIRDVKNDPRWNSNIDNSSDFKTRSILGVPLQIKNNTIGVMELLNKQDENGFAHEDIYIATTLAAQAAVAIENARLWDDVQKAYHDLAELDRLKSEFVSIASHELKTPLAVILGYATFLKDEVTGEATEQLEIVLASAMKLRALIDDMVNLRHVKNNDTQLDISIFSMKSLVQEILEEFKTLFKAKSLKIQVQYAEGTDPVNLEGDRQKIHLVIANLLSNATKFTPEKGSIFVSLARKGQKIYFKVVDTGIGIAQEHWQKIFEDFYQVEPSLTRRFEGLGLGLPIARGMVEIHNGTINVESVAGKGSLFTVILPIAIDL